MFLAVAELVSETENGWEVASTAKRDQDRDVHHRLQDVLLAAAVAVAS